MTLVHKCEGCRYKGIHQEMGFSSTGVCTKTNNLEDAAKAYDSKACPYKIVKPVDKLKQRAVEDFRMLGRMGQNICPVCAYYNHGEGSKKCATCPKMDNFEWHGVQEEG